LIIEATGTIFLAQGWSAQVLAAGELLLQRDGILPPAAAAKPVFAEVQPTDCGATGLDPVQLELFQHRFSAIAERMGERLRQTASSVNIKERLDFSCALFDGSGGLVANAPHIPVHLGSMGDSVVSLLAAVAPPTARPALLIGFAASFAAKLADTCGSEIGKRWGRHTVLITTLRPVPAGTEGAISLEGTGASLVGAAVMALVMGGLGLIHGPAATVLVIGAGLLATLVESVIGATLQSRVAWLSNEVVNGLQTLVAAVLAMAWWTVLPPGAGG
jgi:hypothetical protein